MNKLPMLSALSAAAGGRVTSSPNYNTINDVMRDMQGAPPRQWKSSDELTYYGYDANEDNVLYKDKQGTIIPISVDNSPMFKDAKGNMVWQDKETGTTRLADPAQDPTSITYGTLMVHGNIHPDRMDDLFTSSVEGRKSGKNDYYTNPIYTSEPDSAADTQGGFWQGYDPAQAANGLRSKLMASDTGGDITLGDNYGGNGMKWKTNTKKETPEFLRMLRDRAADFQKNGPPKTALKIQDEGKPFILTGPGGTRKVDPSATIDGLRKPTKGKR